MHTRWIVLAGLLATLAVSPACAAEDGLVTRPSKHTVVETADRLEAGLRQAGATVFARIDYAQSAHDNRLELNRMVLILFGNPKAGTPLMARSPTIGVDLPLKFLVWQDGSGKVFISFNSADYLAHTLLPRHGIAQMPELLNRGVDLADKLGAAEVSDTEYRWRQRTLFERHPLALTEG